MQLLVRFALVQAEVLDHARFDEGDVAVEVGERAIELEIRDHAPQREAQAVRRRVVHAVCRRRLVRLDVVGGDGRAHEDEIVAVIAAVQDVAADGIEKALGQFRPLVAGQQADEMQLGFAPGVVVQVFRRVLVFEGAHAFLHALVVEIDARAGGLLGRGPVGTLEIGLGPLAGLAEQGIMAVEAVQDGARDVESDLGRQQLGKGGLGHRTARAVDGAAVIVVRDDMNE